MRRTVLPIFVVGTALMLASGVALFAGFGPAGAQESPEETLSGVFSVLWVDPKPGSGLEHRVEYLLTDDRGERTRLEFARDDLGRAQGALALDGERLRVDGRGTPGGRFEVQDVVVPEGGARIAAQRTVTGSRPTATLLCRFSNSTTFTPHDDAWFEDLMGATNPGMDHYWREVSYGKVDLTGSRVFGWYNLPRPMSAYQTRAGYDEDLLARDCARAADAEVLFPSYTNVNLMFNGNPDSYALGTRAFPLQLDGRSKSYGMTWMPRFAYEPGSGVNGTGQVWLAHEMGHAFGLPHSSGPYKDPYDSDWDPMSDGSVCSPPHARYGCVGAYTSTYHMDELLGWIPPSRKYTATEATNQNLTLERLGLPDDNGAYLMAQIPIPGSTTRFYTVEARRFAGYDDQVPGQAVVIHKVDTTLPDRNAKVVDPDRNGNPNDAGARWVPGETFVDAANGIEVSVTRATASGYDMTINPSEGADPDAPRLTGSAPPPAGTMARSASVRIEFSEGLDRATLRTPDGRFKNVELYEYNKKKKKRWQFVAATGLTCDAACDTVTLDPFFGDASRLLDAGKYKARIWRDSSGLKDPDGNRFSSRLPAGYVLRDSSLGPDTMAEWVFRAGKR